MGDVRMKKMQCEVCGSTDIKKIDDSIYTKFI